MLESFLTFINQQKLDVSVKPTLLTVSGGVDSIVLAHLFYRAGLPGSIAHCNFGLRGEESDADELFVRQLAEQYNFPIFVQKLQAKEYSRRQGISTQMAARDLRYAWFEEIREEKKYDFIATAHHANDSLETVLLNLTRGTGLAGLNGIAFKNGNLIRPLLFASKDEIKQYASDHKLVYREDSSNESNYYKRNLMRHEVVPVLKQMNPSLEKTFQTTSRRLESAEMLLENFLTEWKKEAEEKRGKELFISIKTIANSLEPAYGLWFILRDYGFSFIQAEEILLSIEGLSGKLFYSPTYKVLKDREFFIVSKIGENLNNKNVVITSFDEIFQTDDLTFEINAIIKTEEFQITKEKDIAYFDADKLVFPLMVRDWIEGDSFCPFGMKGKRKKVSDLLIDLKINLNQKKKIKLLQNNDGEIIWIIGLRTDERYKINDETINIMEIHLKVKN